MKMATMATTIKAMYSKYGTILETYTKDEVHDLLMKNDFTDDESIWYVLQYADQEAWDYVYENRKMYAHRIRTLIEPYDFLPDRNKIKMRHREMTDEDLANAGKEYRATKMKEFEIHWNTIKGSIPDRPHSELDDEFDDAWNILSAARDKITAYTEKRRGAYVAPTARSVIPQELQELESDFNQCKKNYDKIEKLINRADEEYIAKKKDEHFEDWLREL